MVSKPLAKTFLFLFFGWRGRGGGRWRVEGGGRGEVVLSALLHAKTDSRRSERMRSLVDPKVTKAVSASTAECVRVWT